MSGFDVSLSPSQLEAVQEELKLLEEGLKNRALRAGLQEVAKPIVPDMKANVAVLTGDLKQSLGRRVLSKRLKNLYGIPAQEQGVFLGAVRKVNGYSQDYIARLVEHGVDPGYRSVKRNLKGHRARRQDGRYVFYSYESPGIKAQPFMKPALARHSSGVTTRFYKGLGNFLDKQRQRGAIS